MEYACDLKGLQPSCRRSCTVRRERPHAVLRRYKNRGINGKWGLQIAAWTFSAAWQQIATCCGRFRSV